MGKGTKKSKPSKKEKAAPNCTCNHPFTCHCGNRSPRPSEGHNMDMETQQLGGKGNQNKQRLLHKAPSLLSPLLMTGSFALAEERWKYQKRYSKSKKRRFDAMRWFAWPIGIIQCSCWWRSVDSGYRFYCKLIMLVIREKRHHHHLVYWSWLGIGCRVPKVPKKSSKSKERRFDSTRRFAWPIGIIQFSCQRSVNSG
jgi:hypothetical protein